MDSSLDLYVSYFGLKERPFTLVPDPDFLFWSKQHLRAYTMLEYGLLTRSPITLISGEVGAGKTTLLHHLLRSLDENISVAMIANAQGQGGRGELLRWVLKALSQPVEPGADYVEMFHQFQDYLVAEYARGRRVILIFDEAQNLGRDSLEELRMLTNINSNKDELLQLVLVGQPELRNLVRRRDLTQFAQRVSSAFHIPAMDRDTVRAYIGHRLKVAGAKTKIFEDSACNLIHSVTGGVPRLINQLCDLALIYAMTEGQQEVSVEVVQSVLDDDVFFGRGVYVLQNPIGNASGS